MIKTPKAKIKKYALSEHKSVEAFEKWLRTTYHDNRENDKLSIDNVAIEGVLYTMDEYDMDGQYVTLYNKRTDTQIRIDTGNRYRTGYEDAKVWKFDNWGAYRNDIVYLD